MKSTCKVLLLEDNEVDASLMESYLNRSKTQFEVKWVSSAEDFKKFTQSFKPEVIISDYRLKGFSGLDALKYRNQHYGHIPFVVVSGHIGEEKAASLIKEGASDFITKNTAETSLASKILRVVHESQEKEKSRLLEAAVRKNQMLLETITKHAGLPVWIRDIEGKFYYTNKEFLKIFNIGDDVRVIGKKSSDILPMDVANQFNQNDQKVKDQQEAVIFEEKVQTPDGERYYQTNLFPLRNLPDLDYAIGGMAADITSSKQTEFELKEALVEKKLILESIGEAFFSVDSDLNVMYWNHNAEELLGVDKDEVIGKNIWSLFPEAKDLKFYKSTSDILNDQEPIFFEEYYPVIQKWLDLRIYPRKDSVSVFIRDITEQKKSLEELQQAHERYEKVLEATDDAIWDWDLENDNLLWGGGFKTLFGYDVDRVTPSLKTWTDHIHKDDQVTVLSSLYAAIENPEQTNWQSEYKYIKKDGEYAYVIDRAIIMRDENNKAIRVIGAMTDITYHYQYEKDLQNLNEMLQQYTRDLELSNTELEQFAYVASHDLQEPLRMVTSFMELLKTKYDDKLDEKAHQYIYYALDGAKRMRQVILDLLDYSRVGKSEEKKEWVDINEVVDFVCKMQHKRIKDENAALNFENLPEVYTYRSPLIQIFQNLITNALKYRKKDVDPVIDITSKELEKVWQFVVKDNGIGIDSDYFEKIFIIFEKLHPSDEYEGSGLGLTIVKKLVESLGGKVWVASKAGEGSSFNFTLPKSD